MKRNMDYFRRILMAVFFVMSCIGCSGGGSDDYEDVFGDSDFGISAKGNEKAANGIWTGKYGEYVDFTMTLQDGLIIEYEDEIFRTYSDAGYIGRYSLDQNGNFIARMNSSAFGAPITVVTDEIRGSIADNTFTGTWTYTGDSGKVFQCTMNKSESSDSDTGASTYTEDTDGYDTDDEDSGLHGIYTGTFYTDAEPFIGSYQATLNFTDDRSGYLSVENVIGDFYNSPVTVLSLDDSLVTVSFIDAEGDEIIATLIREESTLKGTWKYTDPVFTAVGRINVTTTEMDV